MLVLVLFFPFFSLNSSTTLYSTSPKSFLKVNIFDYFSNEPIRGLRFQLTIISKTGEKLSIPMISGDNGTAIAGIPNDFSLSSELEVSHISFSGIWILEKIVGKEKYLIADAKWSIIEPEKISMNITEYSLNDISFLKEKCDASTIFLKLNIFLAKGRPIGMFNPINEIPRFDPYFKINILYLNFAEFKKTNVAVVPAGKPVVLSMILSYIGSPLEINISISHEGKTFIDLTPSLVRATSRSQINVLKEMLQPLKTYDFDVADLYDKVAQLSLYYEQAAQNFENQSYNEGMKNLYMSQKFYRNLYAAIIETYTSILGWSPTLLVILIFFSYSISQIITEKKIIANIIFVFLFSMILFIFLLTHKGFRFFILGFHHILRLLSTPSFTLMPSFTAFLFQGIQILLIITVVVASTFTHLKDLFSQTFGVSIKNLRRRKMRTLLTLFALVLISASAMCFLSIAPANLVYSSSIPHLKPKVDNGLVIYKQLIVTMKSSSASFSSDVPISITRYIAFQPFEVSSLSKDWFESVNIYGIKTVRLSKLDGSTINNFNTFNVVVVNPEFMERYLNISEVLGSEWLSFKDQNMVLVGSKIALEYNLTKSSEILLNSKKFTVKAIFDEKKAVENLKDIDGDTFLFKIYDPTTGKIVNNSFIIGSVKDFTIQEIEVYRISSILKNEYINNVTNIVNEFLSLGFDSWETETESLTQRYLIRIISKGSISQVYSGFAILTLFGNWYNYIIPLTVTVLLLFMNALGTIFERTSEIRTLFALGASPLRIRLILIIEGIVLGIIGGIFGYIVGYTVAYITSSLLPSLVQENLISSSPFTISFFISLFSSLIGYVVPSGKIVRTAVPSGIITKKVSDLFKIKNESEAILEVPMKLQEKDMRLFNLFLEDLVKKYDGVYYKEIILERLSFSRLMNKNIWNLILRFSDGRFSDFQLLIRAEKDQELEVIVKPFDTRIERITHWSRESKDILKRISPILREELLKFLEFQKNLKKKKNFS